MATTTESQYTLTDYQKKLLSDIFRVTVREVRTDEDKKYLAPGELGINYTEGCFYIKNPTTGELFSPNSIEAIRQIQDKYDATTGKLNADTVSRVRFYSSIDQLSQLGTSMSADTVIRQMEYPSILMASVEYENYAAYQYPSNSGMLTVYKLAPEFVTARFYDNNSRQIYDAVYNSYNQLFEGWRISGSPEVTYLVTSGTSDKAIITSDTALTDLAVLSIKVSKILNSGATISYNNGAYLPIFNKDYTAYASAIVANSIIMLVYDQKHAGYVIVDTSTAAIAAVVKIATDRINTIEAAAKTYTDEQIAALRTKLTTT